jgi:hypothetical protein
MKLKNMLTRGAVIALALVLMGAPLAVAGPPTVQSSVGQTTLNLTVTESLTITPSLASVNFASYSPSLGTATAPPITVVTTGFLAGGHTSVQSFAWLGSSTAALSGPSAIPSSDVFVIVDGSTSAACTMTPVAIVPGSVSGAFCGQTGGSLSYMLNPPAGSYTATDTVTLSLAGATNLTPGSYTGTLFFEADAY